MEQWIFTAYELMAVMLPAILFTGIFYQSKKRLCPKAAAWHSLCLLVFAFYLYGVFHFTGSGTVYHIKQYRFELRMDEINLIPFSASSIDPIGYGLNIVLFLPLGFLLPFLWEKYHALRHALVFGFLLSLLVETSQLLNIRSTDVDDLLLNTLGTALGWLLFRLYFCVRKQTARITDPAAAFPYEALLFVMLLFFCRFFTYYEFGLAKLVYHF